MDPTQFQQVTTSNLFGETWKTINLWIGYKGQISINPVA